MDYEKKYKEEVVRATQLWECGDITRENLEYIFPELKISEGERIRGAIIDHLKDNNLTEWAAWLEKQGEQKPIDKVEPKFKVGDWVFIEEIEGYKQGPFQIKYLSKQGYCFDKDRVIPFCTEDLMSFWTIQDAKDGDVLFQNLMCGKTFIYNGVNSDMAILYSFIVSNDGKDVLPYHIGKPNTGIGYIEENKNIIHPATKEQRDFLFQKMHEAGYEWDSEKKELKKIEQKSQRMISAEAKEAMYGKPAWSEEDELVIKDIEEAITNYWHGQSQEDLLDRLKSLKQRIGG